MSIATDFENQNRNSRYSLTDSRFDAFLKAFRDVSKCYFPMRTGNIQIDRQGEVRIFEDGSGFLWNVVHDKIEIRVLTPTEVKQVLADATSL